jgi:peptidoglycan/LPS O-acetylase OafA/YrhL
MKRAILIWLVAGMVLATGVLWYFSSKGAFASMDYLHFMVILLLILFAVFIGYKRLSSAKRGEPAEDELSKKLVQKAAAWSYYISLYMWVAAIYIHSRVEVDTEVLIGSGILFMAVSFALCWMIFNFRGIRND